MRFTGYDEIRYHWHMSKSRDLSPNRSRAFLNKNGQHSRHLELVSSSAARRPPPDPPDALNYCSKSRCHHKKATNVVGLDRMQPPRAAETALQLVGSALQLRSPAQPKLDDVTNAVELQARARATSHQLLATVPAVRLDGGQSELRCCQLHWRNSAGEQLARAQTARQLP